MPIPCPRTLLALKEFFPDDGEFEDVVACAVEQGQELREYVHDVLLIDVLLISADKNAGRAMRELAERIIKRRMIRDFMTDMMDDYVPPAPSNVISLAQRRGDRAS